MPERPSHKIRPADSVVRLLRQLDAAERAATPDAMELIGLWDEIARVERKWREQIAAGSERRQAGDVDKLADWYARLVRQIDRALRDPVLDTPTAEFLRQTRAKCLERPSS